MTVPAWCMPTAGRDRDPNGETAAHSLLLLAMLTVTALEARNRFGKLLDRVARGEEVVVTRRDKPVARMVPRRGGS
jgi:prevent-host-death family protein